MTKAITKQVNAIGAIVTQVTTSAQGAKVTKKSIISNEQVLEMGAKIGGAFMGFISASDSLEQVRIEIVKTGFKPIDLRQAKADPVGAKQTEIFKSAFIDSVMTGGKSKRTAQDYFEIVAKGIRNNTEIKSTNNRAKGKGKGKGKPADILNQVIAVYNNEGFDSLPDELQNEIMEYLTANECFSESE
jgi:hypothetical protein